MRFKNLTYDLSGNLVSVERTSDNTVFTVGDFIKNDQYVFYKNDYLFITSLVRVDSLDCNIKARGITKNGYKDYLYLASPTIYVINQVLKYEI